MELQEGCVRFGRGDDDSASQVTCKVLLIEFKRLQTALGEQTKLQTQTEFSPDELLHASAGVCSVCLPDMEVSAIYNSLTARGCTVAIVLASPQDILEHRIKCNVPPGPCASANKVECTPQQDDSVDEVSQSDDNSFAAIISDGESSGSEGEPSDEEDNHSKERALFISEAKKRQTLDQRSLESVGVEHCVLGCAAFLRLSTAKEASAVQITLMAVRRKNRKCGIGRYLMQLSKDPGVVGRYNALLAFADHKAEAFFTRHGFSDDPILTAKYRSVADHWENSTLMVYMPPFSEAGLAVGSIKSLTNFQDHYQKWRDLAISGYCIQLGMMERLKHELLLLHNKVQSQEEVISELTRQLREVRQENASLQIEFSQYRKHSQRLLREVAISQAEEWISKETLSNKHLSQESSEFTTNT